MDITILTKLISIVLAISLASERLVTLIKTIFPNLASANADPGSGTPPPVAGEEKRRRIIVMVIAFLSAWLSAGFLNGKFDLFDSLDIGLKDAKIPFFIIGLLASGGSAFWTSLLGYVTALKDVSKQKFLQEKMNTFAHYRAGGATNFIKNARSKSSLKTIRFAAAFTGGVGNLKIQIEGMDEFEFNANGFQDVDLPGGVTNYTAFGSAAPGPGGGVTLNITGPVITNSPQVFGPGLILPNTHALLI